VRLIQRFDKIEILDKDDPLRHNLTLINCIASGVNFRFHAVEVKCEGLNEKLC
jgi:hypothetical protein